MRLNKFVAQATGMSRRAADAAIAENRVLVNGQAPQAGQQVSDQDKVTLDGQALSVQSLTTIILNKPVGYVVSRAGQGAKTIYDLLPANYHSLKPVGRLDKDSSGLLLLTNDGELANRLTHPRFEHRKVYEIRLDTALQPLHQQMINDIGVQLKDGRSQLQLVKLEDATHWRVRMHEGRNRQIRRTFAALGYTVIDLHRTEFGNFSLSDLKAGSHRKAAG
ncbi:MAG TPA: pseudouridine synthase [Candidatus Saccharimonadales bacterium]|nr:pseudouridine synthase [Candidatus Saccharimonadales bacterium]